MALGCKQRLKKKTDFFLLTDLPWAILHGVVCSRPRCGASCVRGKAQTNVRFRMRNTARTSQHEHLCSSRNATTTHHRSTQGRGAERLP
eukprot:3456996-Prymnesium_polylepis.2